MAGTRSSARQAAQNSSSPPSSAKSNGGTKRKAETSSPASTTKPKRGRPSKASKEQKTLEETMPETREPKQQDDTEMEQAGPETSSGAEDKDAYKRPDGCWFWLDNATYETKEQPEVDPSKVIDQAGDSFKGETKDGESKDDPEKALKSTRGGSGFNALDQVKADENDQGKTNKEEEDKENEPVTNGDAAEPAVEEDKSREQAQPDNIMEKGVIYFFTRGRVGVEDPDSPKDLQRSYFVLRPLPPGGKITDGAVQDVSNNRLIALPKKVWPKSGRDRFLAFVEKAGTSMDSLKDEFFQGSDYSTKTVGTRHTPAVTPIGEGVYALSSTGSGRTTTHLSYMLTIPQEIGEVQKDVGLANQGSFALSTKNPETSSPANASLPQGPKYPKEIMEEFGSRGWLPTTPEHLNYANAQFILIGESSGLDVLNGAQDGEKDDKKETPQEEIEKLEQEDEIRVEHMQGDNTVYADLGISKKDYPSVMTTW
ncbi:hypothetical protein LTR36_008776 [Oleoguttula mirabilis]|uniref:Uncharacterized protein n=1 Tax=Oleoguttula mirabilis TaxID=1507867 RepID=A0AAV9JTL3_9PEZI|nr:hypothetical protein LTR36_008776 [Oleoguttula mirabilis]